MSKLPKGADEYRRTLAHTVSWVKSRKKKKKKEMFSYVLLAQIAQERVKTASHRGVKAPYDLNDSWAFFDLALSTMKTADTI